MNGLLYADNYWKSLYNFHYWQVFTEATWMMGFAGVEKATYLLDAEDMLAQKNKLQKGWSK